MPVRPLECPEPVAKLLAPSRRLLSGLERTWLAADRINPPFVNQLVLEGTGQLSEEALKAAVALASVAIPGLRVRLKRALGWSYWDADGPLPSVRSVDGQRWDGCSPKGAPFLEEALSTQGPVAEILLVQGSPFRMVVRTHHAVCDGRGAMLFVNGIFQALRGEAITPIGFGPQTDTDLARQIIALPPEKRRRGVQPPIKILPGPPNPPADRTAPTGKAHIFSMGTTWARIRIPGRFPQLLPRLIRTLAILTRERSETPLRIAIPVDLRPWKPEVLSTANLTGILHLDLARLPHGSEALDCLEVALEEGKNQAAAVPIFAHKLRNVPLAWMARAGRNAALQQLRSGAYPVSATLSNLGKQDMAAWSDKGFICRRAFWIPPGNPGMPLFLAASGDNEGIDLCASMPIGLADENRLDRLLADLRADLLVDNLRALGSLKRMLG
jgi:NRPS condensation-like uncharacterized protein